MLRKQPRRQRLFRTSFFKAQASSGHRKRPATQFSRLLMTRITARRRIFDRFVQGDQRDRRRQLPQADLLNDVANLFGVRGVLGRQKQEPVGVVSEEIVGNGKSRRSAAAHPRPFLLHPEFRRSGAESFASKAKWCSPSIR